jgi:hypothetical protein
MDFSQQTCCCVGAVHVLIRVILEVTSEMQEEITDGQQKGGQPLGTQKGFIDTGVFV